MHRWGMTSLLTITLICGCYGFLVVGCAPPAANPPPITADDLVHADDDHAAHAEHEGHVHAHTYAEAIPLLESFRDQIRDGLAKGDLHAADEALHSIFHALEDVPELAKGAAMSETDQTEVGVAVESLLDAYDKIDEKLHAKEELKYDSVSADVDAAFATLKKFETSAK